jgi:polar amino acid transport system substrate-binding protein
MKANRLLVWAVAGVMTAAAASGPSPVVKACGHHDYPPWNWQQGGRIVGACAVLAQRAIERLGYKVDLSFVGPWKRCQALIAAGQVDVNICSFRNPEREAYSVFAEPRMAQNRIAVFVQKRRAPEFAFSRWEDLQGRRTGLVLGVSMGPEFDSFLERSTHIERVATVQQALQMLVANRLDIVPFGWEAGQIEVARAGLRDRVVPLEKPALVGDLWLSVSKKSPLAARVREIGEYFTRPEYAAEVQQLLEDYGRAAAAP